MNQKIYSNNTSEFVFEEYRSRSNRRRAMDRRKMPESFSYSVYKNHSQVLGRRTPVERREFSRR